MFMVTIFNKVGRKIRMTNNIIFIDIKGRYRPRIIEKIQALKTNMNFKPGFASYLAQGYVAST